MSAPRPEQAIRIDDTRPVGSALGGLLLAMAIVVAGAALGYGLIRAFGATQPDDAQVLAERAARDSTATYEDDTALRYFPEASWLASHNLEIALAALLTPVGVLVAVGSRVRRRGRRRTITGYWIGALGGMAALCVVVAGLYQLYNPAIFRVSAAPMGGDDSTDVPASGRSVALPRPACSGRQLARRRRQAKSDPIVDAAGFRKVAQRVDDAGIFTVSLAQRVVG